MPDVKSQLPRVNDLLIPHNGTTPPDRWPPLLLTIVKTLLGLRLGRISHPSQPAIMRGDPRPERVMGHVPHAKFAARRFDQRRQSPIMDVADPREEMVLNLEIQASDDRRQQSAVAGEIDRRFDLVNGPGGFHPAGAWRGERKGRLLDAMCQLEDDAQHHSLCERGRDVQRQHYPQRVEPQRDEKCQ